MSSLYIDRKGTEIKLSGEALVCYENGERVTSPPLAFIYHPPYVFKAEIADHHEIHSMRFYRLLIP